MEFWQVLPVLIICISSYSLKYSGQLLIICKHVQFQLCSYPTPTTTSRMWHIVNFLKWSKAGFNSIFSFSKTVWGCLLNNVTPTIYGGSLLKSKRCKWRRQKNFQNKAIQTKINLYINKNIKRKHFKTLRIF